MCGSSAVFRCSLAVIGLVLSQTVAAFNFGNMMNPGRWFGGNHDRDYYEDDYYGPGYGGYGGYGYPGYPYGSVQPGYAPGYGAPGYAAPVYGTPGYQAPYDPAAVSAPASSASQAGDADAAEITRLRQRVRELEDANKSSGSDWRNANGTWESPASKDWQPTYNNGGFYNQPTDSQWPEPPSSGSRSNTDVINPGSVPANNSDIGQAERDAVHYKPPVQYPGQNTMEFGR